MLNTAVKKLHVSWRKLLVTVVGEECTSQQAGETWQMSKIGRT